VIRVPNSSPISFTADFPLRIGTDWDAFRVSPLTITLDFPSIFLANAPQLFPSEIFQDGILSGNISLSETLDRPRIIGDVQLVNGKLKNASVNLIEASGRIVFGGNHAALEFFNVATEDVDLSLGGEIDFRDTNDVTFRIIGATPIFDLTSHPIDCMNKIEIASAALTLAPAVAELEFCGGLFQSDWTIELKERASSQSFGTSTLNGDTRKFPLCFSGTDAKGKPLLLGAPPRSEARREPIRPKKRAKGR
jgi:hypothetical protein